MLRDLFINATILVAFTALGSQMFRNKGVAHDSPLYIRVLFGFLTGVLGTILMLFSVDVSDMVALDFRNVPIIMSAINGGPLASLLTASVVTVCGLVKFGLSLNSIIVVAVTFVIGVICALVTKVRLDVRIKFAIMLGVVAVVRSTGFILVLRSSTILHYVLPVYWVSVLLIGYVTYNYYTYVIMMNQQYRLLRQSASMDYLTGLVNVRGFEAALQNAKTHSIGTGRALSVIVGDIDHFKRVNDTYGHKAGDRVLERVASMMKRSCRDNDVVARIGGEEFAIILIDCPPAQALRVAEKVRTTIEATPIALFDNTKVAVTMSLGTATYPDNSSELDQLVAQADSALYEAKRSGRNRVCIYGQGIDGNDGELQVG